MRACVCFQPSTVETESEEYRSHNSTESDLDMKEKGLVVIQDVNTVGWQRHRGKLQQSVTNALFFIFVSTGVPVNVVSGPLKVFCILLFVCSIVCMSNKTVS